MAAGRAGGRLQPGQTAQILRAATLAGTLSGIPSTAWALATGRDPLEATYAAGRMLRPGQTRTVPLLAAAALVHGSLSLAWTALLSRRPRQGLLAGAAIAALDLGLAFAVPSERFAAVRELPVLPQVADHLAFGVLAVGALRWTGRGRPSAPRAGR